MRTVPTQSENPKGLHKRHIVAKANREPVDEESKVEPAPAPENGNSTKPLVTCRCMVCGEEFEGEEPKMCCSGYMCGCRGMPIDPVVCSEECYNKLLFRNGR